MRYLTRALCLMVGLAAALFSLAASGLAQGPGGTALYQESFDGGQATGWQLEPGWQVVQDGNNAVLAGEGHHWARPGVSFGSDFSVQFRLKLLRGRIHLVYRMNDAGRYFIGFQEDKSDLSKQYWPDTFQNGLAGSNTAHSLGAWHQIEIAGRGATLRFLVDDQLEWEYTDADPLTGGSFAFETLDDSQAQVDDITVYGPAPTPTPTPDKRFTWVRTGGPLGGLGYDVRMRPDNPDVMYVTDAKAGVFKSTDGGRTWVPKNNGITARAGAANDEIPVFCLTIDPNNYDILWAGTQFQRGFFKSTDGGETWKKMDNGVVERGLTTRGFGVDPHNSDVVYAAGEVSSWEWFGQTRSGVQFDMVRGVVYKTADGGKSWKKVWTGDNLARYVWIDPRDTTVVYVSTGIFDREAANSDLRNGVDGGVGAIKSTDGGQTWQPINNGLKNLYVGSLFMHPRDPDILLAGTGDAWGSAGAGVYLTTDGGQTWRQTLAVPLMIESVEFSTADPDIAYAGGFQGIYRSQDGGQTWQRVSGSADGWGSPGVMAGHPIDFQVDPRNPDRLFSNQYSGGNFLSLDGGRTWQPASKGYTGAMVRDIVVDPTQPGRVIAAARSGIFVSRNGGGDWIGLAFPPFYFIDWHVVAMDPADPQHIVAGLTCLRNLVSSGDGGLNWHQTQQFPESVQKAFAAVAFAPSDPQTVYAGSAGYVSCGHFTSDIPGPGWDLTTKMPGAGVFISHDGGESWQKSPDPQMQDLAVGRLAVHPQNAQIVYAASFYKGLFRSGDGGQSWSQVRGGLPADQSITTVDFDPHDGNILYAGQNGAGLQRSTDGGQTWQQIAAGLPPEGVITDMAFDRQNPQVVYAAEVSSGVYRSQDGGNTWQTINRGLAVRSINALALSDDGQHLYAATESMGVFRLDLNAQPPAASTPAPPAIGTAAPAPPTKAIPPSATPPPSKPAPTNTPQAPLARPTPTPTGAPTPTPQSKPGICGGIAALPLVLAGMLWSKRRRKM